MRLYLHDLKKEEGKFIPFSGSVKLEINDAEAVIMEINFQAAYISDRVMIKGKWQVDMEGECSRCLEKSTYSLKENFREEFIHLAGPAEQKESGKMAEQDNEERFFFKGELLDLAEYFRQAFLMSQPLKILCRDDCKGLCPICGVNKNREQCQCVRDAINSRWAVLEKIKGDL